MIVWLSKKTTYYIIKKTKPTYSVDMYNYAFFIIYSTLFFGVFSLIVGIIFHIGLESVIFFCSFQAIRIYAGGFHSSKEIYCEIITSSLLLISLLLIKLLIPIKFTFFILLIVLFSTIVIYFLAPMDSSEKPLTKDDYMKFRFISRIILVFLLLLVFMFFSFKNNSLFVTFSMSLILESVLLIAGKLKQLLSSKNL